MAQLIDFDRFSDREEWIAAYGSNYLRLIDRSRGEFEIDRSDITYAKERGQAEYPGYKACKFDLSKLKASENPTYESRADLSAAGCSGHIMEHMFGGRQYIMLTPNWMPIDYMLLKRSTRKVTWQSILRIWVFTMLLIGGSVYHLTQDRDPELTVEPQSTSNNYYEMDPHERSLYVLKKPKNLSKNTEFKVKIQGQDKNCKELVGYDIDDDNRKNIIDYRCWED